MARRRKLSQMVSRLAGDWAEPGAGGQTTPATDPCRTIKTGLDRTGAVILPGGG